MIASKFYEALGRSQPRILGLAAGFHNLVTHFNLPAQGMPGKLLDGLLEGGNWQVCYQSPIDLGTSFRLHFLGRVDISEPHGWIGFLLADQRQGVDRQEFDQQGYHLGFADFVVYFNYMMTAQGTASCRWNMRCARPPFSAVSLVLARRLV